MKTQLPRHHTDTGSSQQVARASSQAHFVDKRPELAMQHKQQNTMAMSAQTTQLKALQKKMQSAQLTADEEPLQAKTNTVRQEEAQVPKPNNTGLPDQLKTGIESLSGMSMDHVKVHYNSSQPAQLNAHAYAQGSDIHVAPGQEQHLPHEAWHVVQQAQGRVKPTMQMKQGVPVNDDEGLEHEADVMGAKALNTPLQRKAFAISSTPTGIGVAQKTPAQVAEVEALTLAHPDMPPTYLNTVAEVKDTDDVTQHSERWREMVTHSGHNPRSPQSIELNKTRFNTAKKAVVDNIPTVRTNVKTTYRGAKEPHIDSEIEMANRRSEEAKDIYKDLPAPTGGPRKKDRMKQANAAVKEKVDLITGEAKDIDDRKNRFPAIKLLPKLIRAAGYIPPIVVTNKTKFAELIAMETVQQTDRGEVLNTAKDEHTDGNVGKLNWLQWFAINTPRPYTTSVKLPLTPAERLANAYTREYELNGHDPKCVHIHWDNSGAQPVVANGPSPAHTKTSRGGGEIETLPKSRLQGLYIPTVGNEQLP